MVVDPGEAGVLQGVGVPHVPGLPALQGPTGPEHVHPDTPLGGSTTFWCFVFVQCVSKKVIL